MQPRCSTWRVTVRGMAALAMLATCGLSGFADPPPAKNDPPKPLPKEIVEAWKKAGAEVGWMRVNKFGSLEFLPVKEGKLGDLPAFRFSRWQEGRLAKLSAPAAAFGLDLRGAQVTGAGLKELAGFKSLQTLGLHGIRVTDAGLKELAGLKSLQSLYLYRTQVTDAGLKELAGLEGLKRLDLHGTRVTDEGLKELAGLKNLQDLNLGETKVTDAGLKELAGLESLQTLNLVGTQVTDAAVRELRKALPGCKITR